MAQRRAFCLAEGVPRAFFTGFPSEHGAWRSTMTRPSPQFPFRPLMPAPKKPQATRAARKPAARPSKLLAERLTQLVSDALSSAAETLLGVKGDEFSLLPLNPVRVVVALSGGRDSMALLDVVEKLFHRPRQYLIARVHAVYVNHGLSPNADAWEAHCRAECDARRIPFTPVRVTVRKTGDGVEAAAREVRYKALARFAREEGCDVVLTAHHEDDRIETFLMQWMRGAGPDGLAAFPQTRELVIPGLAGARNAPPLLLVRPWSGVLRGDIDRYARSVRLSYVEDESNASPKYLRNRIRREVVPLLEQIRPGFRQAAARAVSLTAEAAEVLRSVALDDLALCRDEANPHALRIPALLKLIPARQAWCLRAWMQEEGMQLPNRARLEEGLRQIRQSHHDSLLTLQVRTKEMRRWGSLLVIRDVLPRHAGQSRDAGIAWSGGELLPLPGWNGSLAVIPCRPGEPGVSVRRLREGALEVRERRGAEKMKLWRNRPSKYLKDLFAEAGVPAFERADLPLVWLDGELIFAGALGMNIRCCDEAGGDDMLVRFEFRPQASLLGVAAERPNLADRQGGGR